MAIGTAGAVHAQGLSTPEPVAADPVATPSTPVARAGDSASVPAVMAAAIAAPVSQRLAVQRPRGDVPFIVPPAAVSTARLKEPRTLMIIGGAAFVAGAIIGGTPGTLILVGGTVTGLYGLYKYVQ
jgi:hypothetical protein